jgi:hypothetical protein
MRPKLLALFALGFIVAGCDSATSPTVTKQQPAYRALEETSFETVEEAAAAATAQGILPDAIASAGWTDWSGSSASSYGYFQYLNANKVTASVRLTLSLDGTDRTSGWLDTGEDRLTTGGQYLDPWPHFQKDVAVPTWSPCGTTSHVEAKMDAGFYLLVKWTWTKLFSKPDSDQQWGDQGACATSQYGSYGGGGDDCGWYILQVQDDAGSWYDVGEPFELCGDDNHEWEISKGRAGGIAGGISASTAAEASGTRSASLRLLGTDDLEDRAVAFVQADPSNRADAMLVVDTTRATPEDMEGALLAIRDFIDAGRLNVRIPILKNDLGPAVRERAADASAKLLKQLRSERRHVSVGNRTGSEVFTRLTLPHISQRRTK